MNDLAELGHDYWEWALCANPTRATYLGDHRYDDRLPEIDAAARERDTREIKTLLARLKAIDAASLPETDRVSWDILRLQMEWFLEQLDHKFYQWEVDQMMGPQVWFPELLNYHPLDDETGQRNLLARWRAFPRIIEQHLGNLREGIAEKRVAPRVAVERVAGQIDAMLAAPPFPAGLQKVKNAALKADLTKAIDEAILPAYRSLAEFLKRGYPARDAVGVSAIPGGREAYEYCVRMHTTTSFTAKELHQIGHEELSSIHKEMRAIAKGDEKAFLAAQMKDPRNFHTRKEDLLRSFEDILAEVEARLPQFFDRLPTLRCVVKPIEEYREKDAPAAYYYSPPEDRSRPGIFYANTYKPQTRPRFNEIALAVHEAIPGHHLQIALAIETDLPVWRRHTHFTAFVEGWALYSERLADEMELYETDLDRFGMLTCQAWRACRLVVDTGIHALGWSREQAIGFFRDNVALGAPETANEVDRYIIWPGQALAYKVGQREIQALRREAQATLGARFQPSDFHDVVLRNGALPLSTLRGVVREWVAGRK
ncbi:MAG: DUF885 domain-containing protein [Planctomycetes bacterium]|nr:DUF885 domain-containing protein [Planctomycetota bacterium]